MSTRVSLDLTDVELLALGYAMGAALTKATQDGEHVMKACLTTLETKVRMSLGLSQPLPEEREP